MVSSPSFEGRVALVTGGRGGIGSAVVDALVARGATVVAADIGTAAVGSRFDKAARNDVRLDVTSRHDVEALLAAMEATLGRVDVLVNVAGVVSRGRTAEVSEAEWDRVMSVNLKGTFFCCQAAMPAMIRGGYGRIVNLGSVVGKSGGNARPWIDAGEQAHAANLAYGASKAGVHALTAYLARELAHEGITVNAVAPGPIATAMTLRFPDALKALIPAGRMGVLDDVVHAILFLASAEASYINGEVLDVNGALWCD